ncbi:50S ribosomal protein L5 [Candidatus Wolfebacteria bacterium RBG_13_41_7]|uniref:Large ribosomal subunit protein uL5 n=1 Tax=Candidatus Wolfebacteria bacterium RBG_13_41_7 TaxID=1802554 RepID=A0A1F8DLU2_9BACT|nr:MAG: 50S ribosomal protein L5 [Candidatus Wolfebacteria bacterium RBG_13_41_7]
MEKNTKKNELKNPKIEKVVINVGVGKISQQQEFENKILPEITNGLSLITGQKPVVCKSNKSIAGFKLRAGQTVGLKVTLRRKKMRDFIEKLVNIALPRVRDFRGISLKSIDKNGGLTIGIKEYIVFPEIDSDISKFDFGLEISIVSNAKNKEEAIELYRQLKLPLKKS